VPLRVAQVVQLDPILRATLATVPPEPQKIAGLQLAGQEERALAVSPGHRGRGHGADATRVRLRPGDRAVKVSLRSASARWATGAAALPEAPALLARLDRELCRAPGVKTAEERVRVREPELLKLEHRTGARGLGVSRAVCDDQRVLRGVFRPRLDPLVRHVDGASYHHVADAGTGIEDDQVLARLSTLLHLLGGDPADDSGIEGTRRLLGAKRYSQAARERGRDDHTSDDRDHRRPV